MMIMVVVVMVIMVVMVMMISDGDKRAAAGGEGKAPGRPGSWRTWLELDLSSNHSG